MWFWSEHTDWNEHTCTHKKECFDRSLSSKIQNNWFALSVQGQVKELLIFSNIHLHEAEPLLESSISVGCLYRLKQMPEKCICWISLRCFSVFKMLLFAIIWGDQFCRNWHLFSQPFPHSKPPTKSCSRHQPWSCVFYVKCSIMVHTWLFLGFIYETCKWLLFFFFFSLCNSILSLSCTVCTKQQYPVSFHLCTTIKSFQSHMVSLSGSVLNRCIAPYW